MVVTRKYSGRAGGANDAMSRQHRYLKGWRIANNQSASSGNHLFFGFTHRRAVVACGICRADENMASLSAQLLMAERSLPPVPKVERLFYGGGVCSKAGTII